MTKLSKWETSNLQASAFSDGGEIPRECGYKNGNKSHLRQLVEFLMEQNL